MIDVNAFRMYMRDMKVGPLEIPAANQKHLDQQHVLRAGLCELILAASYRNSDLTSGQKLRVAAKLSAPEVQLQPKRWAEQFELMAEAEGYTPLQIVWALAADVCAVVRVGKDAPVEEEPLTSDGAEEGIITERIVA